VLLIVRCGRDACRRLPRSRFAVFRCLETSILLFSFPETIKFRAKVSCSSSYIILIFFQVIPVSVEIPRCLRPPDLVFPDPGSTQIGFDLLHSVPPFGAYDLGCNLTLKHLILVFKCRSTLRASCTSFTHAYPLNSHFRRRLQIFLFAS